jgi:hypothetical protein
VPLLPIIVDVCQCVCVCVFVGVRVCRVLFVFPWPVLVCRVFVTVWEYVIVRPNVPEDGHIRSKHVVNVKTDGISVPRIV